MELHTGSSFAVSGQDHLSNHCGAHGEAVTSLWENVAEEGPLLMADEKQKRKKKESYYAPLGHTFNT